jgi:hypothetical protein
MQPFDYLSGWLRSRPKRSGQSLQDILEGYRGTALLYVAAKLKIADHLAKKPCRSGELSQMVGARAPALHRVLRGLVALGLCAEREDGAFELTRLGSKLRSDSDGPEYSLAILSGEEYAEAWNHLLHSVTSGGTAFDHVFGESPWEHRQKNSELNQCFNSWLEKGAAAAGRALLKTHDFSRYQIVADIAGGQGALLSVIFQAHRSIQGILLDQPHVAPAARRQFESAGLGSRCRIVEGDFFDAVPAGAEVYILKSVLHNWDDDKCLIILQNCRSALRPGQPLLVVEKILPARVMDRPSTVMGDLHMLAVTGGRERTADEYRKLFAAAGLELRKIAPLRTGHSLLETERA